MTFNFKAAMNRLSNCIEFFYFSFFQPQVSAMNVVAKTPKYQVFQANINFVHKVFILFCRSSSF